MGIFEVSSDAVEEIVALQPTAGTSLGIGSRHGEWDDLSPAGVAAERALWQSLKERAEACSSESRDEHVAKAVLLAECDLNLSRIDAGLPQMDLNNIVSPWQGIRDVLDLMPTETAADWDHIIARLATIDQPLDGYLATLDEGRVSGRTAAHRQVTTAIEQGREASGDVSAFLLLLDRIDAADESCRADGRREQLAVAIDHARASYAKATDWLETTYLPDANPADSVGRERYIASAEQFLGETIDPEARYAWGWSEIARLQAALAEQCAKIDPNASMAEVMKVLHTDPERGASDVESFLSVMQSRQEDALANLDGSHFDVPEQIRTIEVLASPPGGALAPYYTGPSEDFSRPGRVWYPIGERTFFPLYEEVTTAYHEGFPGHHLQVGWQTAMGDKLSRFHRLMTWYPGSGEGWALYAETLMGELGYLEKPDYVVGLLMSQMFRSCRIVIDIGTHCGLPIPDDVDFHPGETWSFELATEMLRERAALDPAFAESEATRYFGWPGQAISYKVGEQAIHDLRAELGQREDFDLKQFHADLLSVGSIGLDLLRELVRTS